MPARKWEFWRKFGQPELWRKLERRGCGWRWRPSGSTRCRSPRCLRTARPAWTARASHEAPGDGCSDDNNNNNDDDGANLGGAGRDEMLTIMMKMAVLVTMTKNHEDDDHDHDDDKIVNLWWQWWWWLYRVRFHWDEADGEEGGKVGLPSALVLIIVHILGTRWTNMMMMMTMIIGWWWSNFITMRMIWS